MSTDESTCTPLHIAVQFGHSKVVCAFRTLYVYKALISTESCLRVRRMDRSDTPPPPRLGWSPRLDRRRVSRAIGWSSGQSSNLSGPQTIFRFWFGLASRLDYFRFFFLIIIFKTIWVLPFFYLYLIIICFNFI